MHRRGSERGFTLIEIMIALAVFAVVVVGAMGVIGAANSSGLVGGIPTALVSGRTAKDITAASTYLRGFQEYMAATVGGSTTLGPSSFAPGASNILGYQPPSDPPYQLDWTGMTVTVEYWDWDCGTRTYVAGPDRLDGTITGRDRLIRVESALSWTFAGAARTVTTERFTPYRPTIGFPPQPVCP